MSPLLLDINIIIKVSYFNISVYFPTYYFVSFLDNEIHFTTIKGAFIALKSIYNKNGIRGLWRGSSTAVPRAGVGSASQLFVYSKSKDWLDDLNASSIFL